MARKVRCPQCGAKNNSDHERCRICGSLVAADTTVIPGTAPPDVALEPLVVERRPLPPGGAAEYFDPNEFEMPVDLRPPPPPTRDDPVVADVEPFDPNALEVGPPADPSPTG